LIDSFTQDHFLPHFVGNAGAIYQHRVSNDSIFSKCRDDIHNSYRDVKKFMVNWSRRSSLRQN